MSHQEPFFRPGTHCWCCTSPARGGDAQQSPRSVPRWESSTGLGFAHTTAIPHHSSCNPVYLFPLFPEPARARGPRWLRHPPSREAPSQSPIPALLLLWLLVSARDERKEKQVPAQGEKGSNTTWLSLMGSFQSHRQGLEVPQALPKQTCKQQIGFGIIPNSSTMMKSREMVGEATF